VNENQLNIISYRLTVDVNHAKRKKICLNSGMQWWNGMETFSEF